MAGCWPLGLMCLYAGVGDGGGEGDPNNGQTIGTRLGKILRIHPDTGGPCNNNNPFFVFGGEAQHVWSLGLRNPWRFSFDRVMDDLYIGDVGQGAREEINVSLAPNAGRALNYGWRLMEGVSLFQSVKQLQFRGPDVAGARLSPPRRSVFGGRVCRTEDQLPYQH